MDHKTRRIKKAVPDFKLIYSDILDKQYPEKTSDARRLLTKRHLSVIDILELNKIIFGESQKVSQNTVLTTSRTFSIFLTTRRRIT
jgi:hypothetical protein